MSRALAYREACEPDMPLVYSSIIDSYRLSHAAGLISMGNWRRVMTEEIRIILARPGVKVWLAYHPGDATTVANLYGLIITDPHFASRQTPMPYVVYCYIKHKFRKRFGIFRGLFAAAGVPLDEPFHYAAKTGVVSKMRGVAPLAKWSPLYIRFPSPKSPTPAERDLDATQDDSKAQDSPSSKS
jgi:hypothetical protein